MVFSKGVKLNPFLLVVFSLFLGATIGLCESPEKTEKLAPTQPKTKTQDIVYLLNLIHANDYSREAVRQTIGTYKKAYPDQPESFWEKVLAESNESDLLSMLVTVYDKHLSHHEVRAMVQFYESPLGKKLALVQPEIARDSNIVGMDFARRMNDVMLRYLAEAEKKEEVPVSDKVEERGKPK